MKNLFKTSTLVILLLVLVTIPALANSDLGDNKDIDVTVNVEKYADIEGSTIGEDDWVDFSAPEGESLKDRLLKAEDVSPTVDEGSSFTGKGGEVKWARHDITIKANTPFMIKATASYPEHIEGTATLNNENSKPKTFYSYLVKRGDFRTAAEIRPGEVVSVSGNDTNGAINYILASKVSMPKEFWEVKAGDYVGNITFTVEAK